jgi:hypothetical protein
MPLGAGGDYQLDLLAGNLSFRRRCDLKTRMSEALADHRQFLQMNED